MNILLGQIEPRPANPERNFHEICGFINGLSYERTPKKVDIAVFPELVIPGYFLGDRFESDEFVRDVEYWNNRLIENTKKWPGLVLVFGTIVTDGSVGEDGRLRKYNAAIVAQNGKQIHNTGNMPYTIKALLPNYRFFADSRHFFSLRQYAEEKHLLTDDLIQPFEVNVDGSSMKLGVMLCEDMWDEHYTLKVGEQLQRAGAELLVNLSASPWGWMKRKKRHKVVRSLAERTGLPLVYVNAIGAQCTAKHFLAFDGRSAIFRKDGAIVRELEFGGESALWSVASPDYPSFLCEEEDEQDELLLAIKVAMKGYLQTLPDELKKVVIGLSGGIDSAVSAVLWRTVLPEDRVFGIAMPMNGVSSNESVDLAQDLAERLRINFEVVPIESIVKANAEALGIKPGTDAYKSVQARARMEVLAGRAHQLGGFFPSNANKTEIAFGYGTLTADLRGTFAPLADMTKREVYQLAQHLNRVLGNLIPQDIMRRPPSDELAQGSRDPFVYGNADERGFHDEFVRAVVQFSKGPTWFLEQYQAGTLEEEMRLPKGQIATLFSDAQSFVQEVERLFGLLHNNFFKRVQLPPAPLLSRRAFGDDWREAHLPLVFSREYKKLKREMLKR